MTPDAHTVEYFPADAFAIPGIYAMYPDCGNLVPLNTITMTPGLLGYLTVEEFYICFVCDNCGAQWADDGWSQS